MSEGLILAGVAIALRGQPLVGPIDLAVAPGEVVTVMGPSGVGKSSLLAYVAGFLEQSGFTASGTISLGGQDVTALPPERRRIGLLFQDDLLFPHLSVGGNLAFGLPARLTGRAARRARIDEALAEAGLEGSAGRDPATLSGGQRARVALLRVLLSEPRALLLDEPFGKLDAELRERMREMVFSAARERALPVLQASHDPADAPGAVLQLMPPNSPKEA